VLHRPPKGGRPSRRTSLCLINLGSSHVSQLLPKAQRGWASKKPPPAQSKRFNIFQHKSYASAYHAAGCQSPSNPPTHGAFVIENEALLNGLVERSVCSPPLPLPLTVSIVPNEVSITVVDPEPTDLIVLVFSGLMCAEGGEPMTGGSVGSCCPWPRPPEEDVRL